MNPAKLKVVELRAELAARGLDTKGNKAALVERLQEALNGETVGGAPSVTADGSEAASDAANSTAESFDGDNSVIQKSDETPEKLEEESGENTQETTSEVTEVSKQEETEPEPEPEPESESEPVPVENKGQDPPESATEEVETKVEEEPKEKEDEANESIVDNAECEESNIENTVEPTNDKDEVADDKVEVTVPESMEVQEAEIKAEKDADNEDNEAEPRNEEMTDENEEDANVKDTSDESNIEMKDVVTTDAVLIKSEPEETKMETDDKKEASIKTESSSEKREDRKRKRSPSPSPQRGSWSPTKTMKEDEPEIDESAVTLSWYDSDLHLMIDKNSFCTATPISDAGFGYIWAGVRGTYGYTSGKICFQVKLLENCDISHLEDEPTPNVLRVGWSSFKTSMQLGEEPFSYGYGGTGKISVNSKFSDYGSSFGVDDIVTAYLEFSESEAIMSFSVNDTHFDAAFTVSLEDLKGIPLVPHVLTKNVKFEVNFGQCDPWVCINEDFTWANEVPLENRVIGPQRPLKKADCEIIMMCGLPGCGKTYWANKHSADNFDKHYNIIGTNALIDKMKVMGLPRKGNYSGRWDVLIEKCTKCLQRLLDIGCQRRRNFILDQTNVFPAAQRRKMRNFEGFIRKAVVIVPTDEEFTRRVQKRELEEGKDVPDSTVLEMKANFTLPDKEVFNEIEYPELPEPEARPLVEKYNKEGINAGYVRRGPQRNNGGSGQGSAQGSSISSVKRFRSDYSQQRPRYDNFRRGPPMHHGGGGGGGSGGGGFRRGGNNAHHGGARSGWQQRAPDRGWRDRNQSGSGGGGGYRSEMRPSGDRGMNRIGSGGWRGGAGGGGGGGSSGSGGGRGRGGSGSGGGGGGSDRNRHHTDRNNRGPSNNQGRGSGHTTYDRRDNNRDSHNRQKNSASNSSHGANNMGSSGGTISSVGGGSGGNSGGGGGGGGGTGGGHQWGQYQQQGQQQGQQQLPPPQQPWAHHHWGGPQQHQPQQQWNNAYQWKSYSGQGGGYNQAQQGFNQQGYNQQQNYGNWQSYGYTGYGQNWTQAWPNWYGAGQQAQQQQPAIAAHSANTSQPPPK